MEVVSEGIVVEKVLVNIFCLGVSKKFFDWLEVKNSGFRVGVGLLGLLMVCELIL